MNNPTRSDLINFATTEAHRAAKAARANMTQLSRDEHNISLKCDWASNRDRAAMFGAIADALSKFDQCGEDNGNGDPCVLPLGHAGDHSAVGETRPSK